MITIKTFARNLDNADTAHVVVRMNRQAHDALKLYMHQQGAVMFPRNVRMSYRGFGWYRLDVWQTHDARAKLELALKIIEKFLRTQQRAADEDRKLERLNAQGQNATAYVSSDVQGHAGRYIAPKPIDLLPNKPWPHPVMPAHTDPHFSVAPHASADALAALRAHFAR